MDILLLRLLTDLIALKIIYDSKGSKIDFKNILVVTIINLLKANIVIRFIGIIFIEGKKDIMFKTITYLKIIGISLVSGYIFKDLGVINIIIALLFILLTNNTYLKKILNYNFFKDLNVLINLDSIKEVYIDTGNNLEYKGIPVLFTKDKNYYSKEIEIEFLVIGNIQKKYGDIMEVELIINNKTVKKNVFIIYDEFMKYDLLGGLNLLKFT